MKYEVQRGDILDLIAPYDLLLATGYVPGFKIGSIIGVAVTNASSGAAFEGAVAGVFTVKKPTGEVWAVGDEVYWDDTNKDFTKTSTSNSKAGYALSAQLTGDTAGNIKLFPTL